jgi:hypoxanthine phosphoribosyltransferase
LIQLKDKTFTPFIQAATIQTRIAQIANELDQEYSEKNPVFIVMLKGAFLFAADLLKNVTTNCEIIFIRLKSYEGTHSTGQVKVLLGIQEDLKNRHVIILEDIVDSGKTLHDFLPMLQQEKPASIKVATLLFKPESLKYDIKPNFVGFEISNEFVVGYGLDYDELGRNLPDIYQVIL